LDEKKEAHMHVKKKTAKKKKATAKKKRKGGTRSTGPKRK